MKFDEIKLAQNLIKIQIDALQNLKNNLSDSFDSAIESLFNCKGNIVISGLGKSGIIARKISSTMCSYGISSFYINPVEMFHGDIGCVDLQKDHFILISKSGETKEIVRMATYLKKNNVPIISFTNYENCTLKTLSEVNLCLEVEYEACLFNLAPTTSATLSMVLGDTLTTILANKKGLSHLDYANNHPDGSLGQKLLLSVKNIMHTDELPTVFINSSIQDCILAITNKCLGVVVIITTDNQFVGTITGEDISDFLQSEKEINLSDFSILNIINKKKSLLIDPDSSVYDAQKIMDIHKITYLPVVKNNILLGLIHLKDIINMKLEEM